MSRDPDLDDDDLLALAEIRDFSLAVARRFKDAALADRDDEAALRLARGLHAAERSLRQSVLMRHKLRREQRLDAYAVARAAREDAVERGAHRKLEVEKALQVMIRRETEKPEAERLTRELSERLGNAKYFEGFADRPLADHIAALRAEIGLDRQGAPPPEEVSPEPPERASAPQPEPACDPVPPPQGEVSPEATEGVSASESEPAGEPDGPGGPPQSLRDSSPEGGATAPESGEPEPPPPEPPPPPPVPKWLSDAYKIDLSDVPLHPRWRELRKLNSS